VQQRRRDILVAPVVEKGATCRKVYLPDGLWYDFWSGTPVMGGQEVPRYVDLSTLPLYVRAGAILPLDPVRQYVDEPTDHPTTLNIYSGADGTFVLYEDDGISLDSLKDRAVRTRFRWNDLERKLVIELLPGSGSWPSPPRQFEVRVIPRGGPQRVEYAGQRVEVSFRPAPPP
jgi:alpha-glucosidase